MWKDWLHFSARERNGIYVLLILMFLLMGFNLFAPKLIHPKTSIPKAYFVILDSLRTIAHARDALNYSKENHFFVDSLFSFNPNTIDSSGLRKLGFGLQSSQQLLKYREKGGVFRIKKDVSKLYAISDSEFSILKPYLSLPDSFNYKASNEVPKKKYQNRHFSRTNSQGENPVRQKKTFIVELNTADTSTLKTLYGIGSRFASRIVKYRQLLGGYAFKKQLLEVYGFPKETFDLIRDHMTIDTSLIQKIPINLASVSRLKAHPYIDFYQAKAIYEYRRDSLISDFDNLLHIEELDTAGMHRLEYYIDYQTRLEESSNSVDKE